jgi:hypothetical protein
VTQNNYLPDKFNFMVVKNTELQIHELRNSLRINEILPSKVQGYS